MELGKLGVWAPMDVMSAAEGAAFAKRVEGWGYAALWLPESRGRNVLVHSSWLLANTQKLIVATGHRQHLRPRPDGDGERPARRWPSSRAAAFCSGSACRTRPTVEGLRGHTYGKPVATMRGLSRRRCARRPIWRPSRRSSR